MENLVTQTKQPTTVANPTNSVNIGFPPPNQQPDSALGASLERDIDDLSTNTDLEAEGNAGFPPPEGKEEDTPVLGISSESETDDTDHLNIDDDAKGDIGFLPPQDEQEARDIDPPIPHGKQEDDDPVVEGNSDNTNAFTPSRSRTEDQSQALYDHLKKLFQKNKNLTKNNIVAIKNNLNESEWPALDKIKFIERVFSLFLENPANPNPVKKKGFSSLFTKFANNRNQEYSDEQLDNIKSLKKMSYDIFKTRFEYLKPMAGYFGTEHSPEYLNELNSLRALFSDPEQTKLIDFHTSRDSIQTIGDTTTRNEINHLLGIKVKKSPRP